MSPVLPDLATSGKLAGYQLEERIGEGDVAVVFRARDERLDRTVAVKILAPELTGDPAFRDRLAAESRATAAIGHPHILAVYEAGQADGILYVAMRHAADGDVGPLLGRPGPVRVASAWSVITQVASALDAAHDHGLVHRDVKPANMLLDGGQVYLSDFGAGRDVSPEEIIATGQVAGALALRPR